MDDPQAILMRIAGQLVLKARVDEVIVDDLETGHHAGEGHDAFGHELQGIGVAAGQHGADLVGGQYVLIRARHHAVDPDPAERLAMAYDIRFGVQRLAQQGRARAGLRHDHEAGVCLWQRHIWGHDAWPIRQVLECPFWRPAGVSVPRGTALGARNL